jgi:peptidoglycan/LPS O-acetylase OafA/YrhL
MLNGNYSVMVFSRSLTSKSSSTTGSGYLPTLDGWRALAIVAVMFHHGALLHWGPFSTRWLYDFGGMGVQIFFAISGILICTRLLEEEKLTGSLHLKGFYIRRVLRIQPAALLFLLLVLVLKIASVIPLSTQGFLAALFLVRNYLPWHAVGSTDWATLHFWSLSVEEHFYLLLPAFLLFVRQWRVRLLLIAVVVLIAWSAIASRYGLLGPQAYHRTDLCLSELLIPSALAVLLRRQAVRAALERYLSPWAALLFAAFVMIPVWTHSKHALHSATCLVPTAVVLSTMLHSRSALGRFLEWKPIKFVGRISFGLYLWQELFFVAHIAPELRPFGLFNYTPLNFVAVFLLATASFYLIERPCMRLGHRLARPAVEGRPELAALQASPPKVAV